MLRDNPRDFSEDRRGCSSEVQEVVLRCLRKDPDQRFQSMTDVKDALEQIYFASRSGILQMHSGVWKVSP